MIVYLNGRFVSEEHATVSIHDRGFLYGDGLFETIRVYNGEPFLWADHIARLQRGCRALRLNCPLSANEILLVLREALRRNGLRHALVRLTLSRGVGARGYSPQGADDPTFVMALFPAPRPPPAYRVIVSSVRLHSELPVADLKHLNKLPQIIARSEADAAGANEALLTSVRGFVLEGTSTNVFWISNSTICTPPVRGILAGTTRSHVLRLCRKLGYVTDERNIHIKQLSKVEGLFLTSSVAEVMRVSHVNGMRIPASRIVRELQQRYRTETFPQ